MITEKAVKPKLNRPNHYAPVQQKPWSANESWSVGCARYYHVTRHPYYTTSGGCCQVFFGGYLNFFGQSFLKIAPSLYHMLPPLSRAIFTASAMNRTKTSKSFRKSGLFSFSGDRKSLIT